MGVVEVDGPDGRRWTVRRRRYWPGWRENVDVKDAPIWLPDDFGVGGIVAAVAATIFLGLLILLLLPLVLLLGELLLILVALVLLGGIWVVEASTPGPPMESRTRKVWGGRRSQRAAENLARELREIPAEGVSTRSP